MLLFSIAVQRRIVLIIPNLKVRKLRLREIKSFVQGNKAIGVSLSSGWISFSPPESVSPSQGKTPVMSFQKLPAKSP